MILTGVPQGQTMVSPVGFVPSGMFLAQCTPCNIQQPQPQPQQQQQQQHHHQPQQFPHSQQQQQQTPQPLQQQHRPMLPTLSYQQVPQPFPIASVQQQQQCYALNNGNSVDPSQLMSNSNSLHFEDHNNDSTNNHCLQQQQQHHQQQQHMRQSNSMLVQSACFTQQPIRGVPQHQVQMALDTQGNPQHITSQPLLQSQQQQHQQGQWCLQSTQHLDQPSEPYPGHHLSRGGLDHILDMLVPYQQQQQQPQQQMWQQGHVHQQNQQQQPHQQHNYLQHQQHQQIYHQQQQQQQQQQQLQQQPQYHIHNQPTQNTMQSLPCPQPILLGRAGWDSPSAGGSHKEEVEVVQRQVQLPETSITMAHDKDGCRVFQQLLEDADSDERRTELFSVLRGSVCKAMVCANANHVVQKYIVVMKPSDCDFIAHELLQLGQTGVLKLARHKYGYRVLQRLLEHLHLHQVFGLCEILCKDAAALSAHRFGTYVIQDLLAYRATEFGSSITRQLCQYMADVCLNNDSCMVLEAALIRCSGEDVDLMLSGILNSDGCVGAMAHMRRGHTVCLSLLSNGNIQVRQEASRQLLRDSASLRTNRFGRMVMRRVADLCGTNSNNNNIGH